MAYVLFSLVPVAMVIGFLAFVSNAIGSVTL